MKCFLDKSFQKLPLTEKKELSMNLNKR